MKKENEYKVEVLIDNEIDMGVNIFAYNEVELMDKTDDLIRERVPEFEDSDIDVMNVTKLNNQ
jgi:hypothetical protein